MVAPRPRVVHSKLTTTAVDATDEAAIAEAAEALGPVDLVLVSTGMLRDEALGLPEKAMRALSAEGLMRTFLVNAVAPALVAKHVLPRTPRTGRALFAALSARVGSIEDNRLGGWHAYRASKAALNQLVRTLSVELKRTRPEALCVALHPGTVDTALSKPFQGGVTPERLFAPDRAAGHLLDVLAGLSPEDSGGFFAWDGARVPF